MSNNSDIQQFKDFTGADDQTAQQFLSMFNNNLDAAVSAFLDQASMPASQQQQPQVFDNNMSDVYDQLPEPAYNPNLQQPAPKQQQASMGRRLGSTADPQASDFVPFSAPAPKKTTTTVPKEKPKFATLHNKDDDSDEDENPKNNKYFAGGSKNSGTQIIGNNDDDDDDDDDMAKRIFKAAKERGAKPADSDKKQPAAAPKFTGQGNRLGSDAAVPKQPLAQPLMQPLPQQPQQPPQERTMTITFYSDGFTIDDGELRSLADPQSQMLLKAIESGMVPPELAKGAKSVLVSLVKKEGKYVPPPKVFKAFEGHGKTLSSAPSPTTPVSAPKPATTTTTTPKASYSCDLNKPHTSIQLRLHDGTRMVAKFNLTDAVQVLYDFVAMASGVQNFMLGSAFPKKDLTDKSQTVEQAKLQNASLVQTKL